MFEVVVVDHHAAFKLLTSTRVNDYVTGKVDNVDNVVAVHAQQCRQAGREGLKHSNVGDRLFQLDVSHAVATHRGFYHIDLTLLAFLALVFNFFVTTATAFITFDRTKNAFIEQTVFFGLKRFIV